MIDNEKKKLNPEKLLEDFKKCQENLQKLEKERDDFLAGWQRERADFLNYKKEQAEIFGGLQKMVSQILISEILPVLDNFELSFKHLPENMKDNEWVRGLIQVYENFKDILKNQGVEEIKTKDEKFNPEFHEAVEKVESEKEEGMIVEEIQKGYLMHGKVIRPTRAKVSVKPKEKNQETKNTQ